MMEMKAISTKSLHMRKKGEEKKTENNLCSRAREKTQRANTIITSINTEKTKGTV